VSAELDVHLAFTPAPGTAFTIIDARFNGPIAGMFDGLAEGATFDVDTTQFRITYAGGDGNDVVLTVVPGAGRPWRSAPAGRVRLLRATAASLPSVTWALSGTRRRKRRRTGAHPHRGMNGGRR
jgi:hypothetical protein